MVSMSKVTTRNGVDPQQKFDELRSLANTEYFDIMLLHWQHTATWPADTARWESLYAEGTAAELAREYDTAIARYLAAAQIDDHFANLHFLLARCLEAARRYGEWAWLTDHRTLAGLCKAG